MIYTIGMKDNFTVKRIKHQTEYAEWLLKKHYAHRIPSISYAFGLYENGVLRGVCTFGTPASHTLCIGLAGEKWSKSVIELNRLVVECSEINITSWFVSRCLTFFRGVGPLVVSYADTGQGHVGKIYQACNFLFTGTTKERTDINTGEGKHSRHYDKNQDYSENRKTRTAKHRYIYIAGLKKYKKKLLAAVNYPILPYPKGETKRYDASYKPISQMVMF